MVEDIGILGIRNRTENWKTARYFAPFFGHGAKKLAKYLSGEPIESSVRLELYWKGMRDFLDGRDENKWKAEIAERFRDSKLFGNLRERVLDFVGFQALKDHNYTAETEGLYGNLYHTEIDIVLESQHALFIGEAKGEMSLSADSKLVLVHQLIRQYVMANILVDIIGVQKCVVPFVVGCDERQHQIQFMVGQGWMKKRHILRWDQIEQFAT